MNHSDVMANVDQFPDGKCYVITGPRRTGKSFRGVMMALSEASNKYRGVVLYVCPSQGVARWTFDKAAATVGAWGWSPKDVLPQELTIVFASGVRLRFISPSELDKQLRGVVEPVVYCDLD